MDLQAGPATSEAASGEKRHEGTGQVASALEDD